MNIDNAKENIQPLAGGRDFKILEVAINADLNQEEAQQELMRQRNEYENAITNYKGEDPLELWFEYIIWLEQSCPKSGKESAFDELLKKCLVNFSKFEKYFQDRRMIKLYIKYIDSQPDPTEYYQQLYNSGIGTMISDFYICWAYYYDIVDNFSKANDIFCKGLDAKAQPAEELIQAHQTFCFSMSQRMLNKDENSKRNFLTNMEERRQALTSLKAYKHKYVGSTRTGNAIKSYHPVKISNSENIPNTKINVYQDFNEDVVNNDLPHGGSSIIQNIADQVRHQENKREPGPWSNAKTIKSRTQHVIQQDIPALGFTIMEDDFDVAPLKSKVDTHEYDELKIRLPSNFISKNLPQTEFLTDLIQVEDIKPNSLPRYNKIYAYPGDGNCYSPEEINAYFWFKKSNIRNKFTEQKDIIWSNGYNYKIRLPPNFIHTNIKQEDFITDVCQPEKNEYGVQFQFPYNQVYPDLVNSITEFSLEEILRNKRTIEKHKKIDKSNLMEISMEETFILSSRIPSLSNHITAINKFDIYVDDEDSKKLKRNLMATKIDDNKNVNNTTTTTTSDPNVFARPYVVQKSTQHQQNFIFPLPQQQTLTMEHHQEQQHQKEVCIKPPQQSSHESFIMPPPQTLQHSKLQQQTVRNTVKYLPQQTHHQADGFMDCMDEEPMSTQHFNFFIKSDIASTPISKKNHSIKWIQQQVQQQQQQQIPPLQQHLTSSTSSSSSSSSSSSLTQGNQLTIEPTTASNKKLQFFNNELDKSVTLSSAENNINSPSPPNNVNNINNINCNNDQPKYLSTILETSETNENYKNDGGNTDSIFPNQIKLLHESITFSKTKFKQIEEGELIHPEQEQNYKQKNNDIYDTDALLEYLTKSPEKHTTNDLFNSFQSQQQHQQSNVFPNFNDSFTLPSFYNTKVKSNNLNDENRVMENIKIIDENLSILPDCQNFSSYNKMDLFKKNDNSIFSSPSSINLKHKQHQPTLSISTSSFMNFSIKNDMANDFVMETIQKSFIKSKTFKTEGLENFTSSIKTENQSLITEKSIKQFKNELNCDDNLTIKSGLNFSIFHDSILSNKNENPTTNFDITNSSIGQSSLPSFLTKFDKLSLDVSTKNCKNVEINSDISIINKFSKIQNSMDIEMEDNIVQPKVSSDQELRYNVQLQSIHEPQSHLLKQQFPYMSIDQNQLQDQHSSVKCENRSQSIIHYQQNESSDQIINKTEFQPRSDYSLQKPLHFQTNNQHQMENENMLELFQHHSEKKYQQKIKCISDSIEPTSEQDENDDVIYNENTIFIEQCAKKNNNLNVDDDDVTWNNDYNDNNCNDYLHKTIDLNETKQFIEHQRNNINLINPFDQGLLEAFLIDMNFVENLQNIKNCNLIHHIDKLRKGKQIEISNNKFEILKLIGRGAYGNVFSAKNKKNGKIYAIKQEKPPNLWEYYICLEITRRIANTEILSSFMCIDYALIGNNASILVTDYIEYGTLIDINNIIKMRTTRNIDEFIVMYFVCEILSIIDHLHSCNIIHCDIKPDNIMLMSTIVPNSDKPVLKLIDFGSAIDMTQFKPGTSFNIKLETKNFICTEMLENRPWTYQTDLFCIASTAHVMLFGRYMEIEKKFNRWCITSRMPRYFNSFIWNTFFDNLINIRDCNSLPNLQEIKLMFKEILMAKEKYVIDKILEFNQAITN